MKIGILTFHFSDNFGAALQAYALRRWFINQGYEASFVNYCPEHVEHGGNFVWSFSKKAVMVNLKVIFLKFSALKNKFFGDAVQQAAFREFRSTYLGVTGPKLLTYAQLCEAAPTYDMLVCGSDQIWSPSLQHGLDRAYFLAFGDTTPPRRISYAASFGNAVEENLVACGAQEFLRRLDSISVRESSGLQLINKLTGRDAVQVADPTCLLDSYDDLVEAANVTDNDHVFCYALRTDQGIRELAEHVKKKLNATLVCPKNPHSRWRPIGLTRNPGPKEWLALIYKSSYVVTNSFHGTMFSILMEKPFIVAGIPGKKKGLNDRMISLLTNLGLSDRLMFDYDELQIDSLLGSPIDWPKVRERLIHWRKLSENFLLAELESL